MIKHYSLRLILWLNGHTPLNFIKFLDQCAKLIFLKKVGGGYIFIHRMLLEYFADLGPNPRKVRMGKRGRLDVSALTLQILRHRRKLLAAAKGVASIQKTKEIVFCPRTKRLEVIGRDERRLSHARNRK